MVCHSGKKPKGGLDLSRRNSAFKGGESGKAILPGKPVESLLWQRIDDDEMPPKNPLSQKEKTILKKWIAEGAQWGTETIDPFRFTTEHRAGYDWWSLQPLKKPKPPEFDDHRWSRNEIDRFILAGLQSKNFSPSRPASPRVLLRRLYFDLIGLPPAPEEVERFVANPSEEAYRKTVEKLLASPRYGERWARHWLDVVRFGESDGFERNGPRRNLWHYRDWVIRALNNDMPYDRFVKMQIAGDLLEPGPEGIAAAGFLVAGVHNTVVGSSERMKRLARQDELEESIGTLSQTFLGLTVNCARCHDHKFDPIPSKDYYRMIAAIDGVNHGERNVIRKGVLARLDSLQKEIAQEHQNLQSMEAAARRTILAERKKRLPSQEATLSSPKPFAEWDFENDLRDKRGNLHGHAVGGARIENGALVLNGQDAYVKTNPLERDFQEKTLEAWVMLDNLSQRGGAVMSVETTNGSVFESIVFGERQPGQWMAGSDFFRRTKSFGGCEEELAQQQPVHIAIVYWKDGTVVGYRNGVPYGKSYKSQPVTFRKGQAHVVLGLRHSPANSGKLLQGKILKAQLYDRALSGSEIAISSRRENEFVSEKEIVAALGSTEKMRKTKIEKKLAELEILRIQLHRISRYKIYTVVPRHPEAMRIHFRGSVTDFGEEVSPGGISSLKTLKSDFGLQVNASDSARRKKLAEWIANKSNSIFARVIVNRIWHYHFGRGIVETPNDFGFNGGRPSHPELLDWLAVKFLENGSSLKSIHRLIVLSSTYRQSSRNDEKIRHRDAGNRYLWRFSPRRMDAEVLRDSILQVAGRLNTKMYGPGFVDVTVTPNNGTTYYTPIDPVGEEFQRRTVYRFCPRGERSTILDTFDCPDPSTTTPRRNVTTTPLQALSLMNNSFVQRMAKDFAKRIQKESGENVTQQIRRAWLDIYQRLPDTEEENLAEQLVLKHGLPVLCRALFNSNEFVVIE